MFLTLAVIAWIATAIVAIRGVVLYYTSKYNTERRVELYKVVGTAAGLALLSMFLSLVASVVK